MGKKRKLNRLITRWIKSDLPEERSTVLLLGVTRIPTSPTPTRRPCSLPLGAIPAVRDPLAFARRNSSSSRREATRRHVSTRKQSKPEASGSEKLPPPSQSDNPCQETGGGSGGGRINTSLGCASDIVTPTISNSHEAVPGGPVMDRSVDSIGTCSLDVEASLEVSDCSEGSSVGTLRSASLASPSPEPRLPSYLSLACTVSGYSTTTNYDPVRLARSRDTSPHRLSSEHVQDNLMLYTTVHNNLLSPPNLVPLPIRKAQSDTKNMTEHHTMTHHRQEFYRSINTVTVLTTDTKNITSTLLSSDSVDACVENGFRNASGKCMSFESKSVSTKTNGSATTESKSFIQQRIERLYGPGALAQGFFVMKRQNKNNKSFEIERPEKNMASNEKHSKSFDNQLLDEDLSEAGNMKQSASSPALPVLRHLRPEFRAQLPIMVPKKDNSKSPMQKSVTVPRIDEVKVNGRSENESVKPVNGNVVVNGNAAVNEDLKVCDTFKSDGGVVKDGHYFLKILETETKRLLVLAEAAEEELNTPGLCEEAKGYLRSASGKAKLLVSQKMQQFKGLCTKNITQVAGEAFPTTNEDLQGFWDMVMLQVDQVDMIFKELDSLRANNWQEKIETNNVASNGIEKPRKVIKTRPVSAAAEQSRRQREAQRKKLIEDKRKAMREQKQQMRQNIEIFVPESSS